METIRMYRPEQPNYLRQISRDMPTEATRPLKVTLLLKLSENAVVPTNPIYLLKQGTRYDEQKESFIQRFKLCEFEAPLRPGQEFKFQFEGSKKGELLLSNLYEAAPN